MGNEKPTEAMLTPYGLDLDYGLNPIPVLNWCLTSGNHSVYYHVTPKRNLPRIFIQGLLATPTRPSVGYYP